MRTNKKSLGFTIVELLVVIVVIGILAGITIVSYTGITQRANTTKALTNATSAAKVADLFAANKSYYPGVLTDFTTNAELAKMPTGVTVVTTATLSGTNGDTTVRYERVGTTTTNATGGRITYWDFGTGAVSTNIIYVGTANSSTSNALFVAAS